MKEIKRLQASSYQKKMNDDGDEKSNVGTMGDNIVIILYGDR